jgi:hypothetical protein
MLFLDHFAFEFISYFRLTIKLPMLLSHLTESKIIQSLLTTLNLSSDMILHIVKYFLEHPIDNKDSSKSQTNFEDID